MTDTHDSKDHGSGMTGYLVIFAALSIFTIVSFVVYGAAKSETITRETSFLIILTVAVCKALLVAIYFMHLKFDWGKLYFMIVPAMILGCLLVVVLLPDIVLAWKEAP